MSWAVAMTSKARPRRRLPAPEVGDVTVSPWDQENVPGGHANEAAAALDRAGQLLSAHLARAERALSAQPAHGSQRMLRDR
jgi:hypothetical protein